MKSTIVLKLLLAVALFSLTGAAQETRTIRGKVKPQKKYDCGNRELGWTNITVKVRSRGQAIDPNPQRSQNEDWSHPRAPVGANVSIGFFHDCYRPWKIPSYDVTSADSQNLPPVELSPMDACSQCPSRSRPARSAVFRADGMDDITHASRTAVKASGDTGGPAKSEPADVMVAVEPPEPEVVENKPTPEELQKTLEEDAAIAQEFESLDIFHYNFEVLELAYASNPALSNVLNKFRTNPENSALFKEFGPVRAKAFQNIIEKPLLGRGTFDPDEALALLRESSIDPSIRGSAVVALLDSDLKTTQTEALRGLLRQSAQDKSSDIYFTSVIALARIGSAEDRTKIAGDIKSADSDVALAALNAIRVSQITEGTNPFGWTIQSIAEITTSSKDPELRQAAILALRPSVYYYRRESAIRTLRNALQRDDNAEVRAEAAEALGLGRLEMRPDVRNALLRAMQTDLSNAVRMAADNSLTGRAH